MKKLQKLLVKRNLLLACPDCQNALPITKDQLNKTTTKCKTCHTVFDYSDQLEAAGLELPNMEEADFISIQKGLAMRHTEHQLEIVLRAKDLFKSDLITFTVVTTIFLLLFSYSYLTDKSDNFIFYFFILIPLFILAIKLLFDSIVFWNNTAYLTVNKEMISVEHTPRFFLAHKNHELIAPAIAQITIQPYEMKDPKESLHEKRPPMYTYGIDVVMKNGEVINLIKDLAFSEDAVLLQEAIEKKLGISSIGG